jgi:hypothetical protein
MKPVGEHNQPRSLAGRRDRDDVMIAKLDEGGPGVRPCQLPNSKVSLIGLDRQVARCLVWFSACVPPHTRIVDPAGGLG